jgi:hypothetical protein
MMGTMADKECKHHVRRHDYISKISRFLNGSQRSNGRGWLLFFTGTAGAGKTEFLKDLQDTAAGITEKGTIITDYKFSNAKITAAEAKSLWPEAIKILNENIKRNRLYSNIFDTNSDTEIIDSYFGIKNQVAFFIKYLWIPASIILAIISSIIMEIYNYNINIYSKTIILILVGIVPPLLQQSLTTINSLWRKPKITKKAKRLDLINPDIKQNLNLSEGPEDYIKAFIREVGEWKLKKNVQAQLVIFIDIQELPDDREVRQEIRKGLDLIIAEIDKLNHPSSALPTNSALKIKLMIVTRYSRFYSDVNASQFLIERENASRVTMLEQKEAWELVTTSLQKAAKANSCNHTIAIANWAQRATINTQQQGTARDMPWEQNAWRELEAESNQSVAAVSPQQARAVCLALAFGYVETPTKHYVENTDTQTIAYSIQVRIDNFINYFLGHLRKKEKNADISDDLQQFINNNVKYQVKRIFGEKEHLIKVACLLALCPEGVPQDILPSEWRNRLPLEDTRQTSGIAIDTKTNYLRLDSEHARILSQGNFHAKEIQSQLPSIFLNCFPADAAEPQESEIPSYAIQIVIAALYEQNIIDGWKNTDVTRKLQNYLILQAEKIKQNPSKIHGQYFTQAAELSARLLHRSLFRSEHWASTLSDGAKTYLENWLAKAEWNFVNDRTQSSLYLLQSKLDGRCSLYKLIYRLYNQSEGKIDRNIIEKGKEQ